MHELTLVERLRAEVPPPADLTAAAARFEAALADLVQPHRRPCVPAPRSLSMPRAVLAGGLAAVLVAGAVAGERVGNGHGTGQTRIVPVSAVEVLHRAAVTARREPVARADQFLYVKLQHTETPLDADEREDRVVEVSEVWQSADGRHEGLSITDGRRERIPYVTAAPQRTVDAATSPVTRPGATAVTWPPPTYVQQTRLPTDPGALLTYLNENPLNAGPEQTPESLERLNVLLSPTGPPKLRAAVFEATARQPGVTVLPDVVDAAGRHGVAIAWQRQGPSGTARSEWIFEPRTYRLLAMRSPFAMCAEHDRESERGTCEDTVLGTGVVGRAGQRP
jgi:hypothetical protein